MTVRRAAALAFVLLVAFVPLAVFADGTTVYAHRIVVKDPGDLALGDLVQVSGTLTARAAEALARSVATVGSSLVYVPVDAYRGRLDAAFGTGAIVVGTRSLVVPRGSALETQAGLLERLADWIAAQGLAGPAVTEISVVSATVRGTPGPDASPTFQAQPGANGGTDISFSLLGATGGSVIGKLSIAGSAAGAAVLVKAGAPVNVVFHKGVITIEMPGKALAAAAVGQKVTVNVPDSQRTFTGTLVDGKAVQVDLP